MSIALSRYVDIISGVGAGANVSTRNLGGMVITANPLVPTGQLISFTSADEVLNYFGSTSEEYKRAAFYFGWISKNITAPQKLSFYHWNNELDTASLIYGRVGTYAVSSFTGVTLGALNLTVGGFTNTLTAINLSAAGSLAAVASSMQTAIRSYTAGGLAWTGATVSFDAVRGSFNFVSGDTGTDVIAVGVAGVGTDLAPLLGWTTGAIFSNGTDAMDVQTDLANLLETSNDFGSFCFTYGLAPNLATVQAAATWNNSTSPNMMFIYSQWVTAANAATWKDALEDTGGVTLTLQYPGGVDPQGAYHEMMPMMVFAATNYNNRNSVQNYMFQIFNATPTVTTDEDADIYDELLINYYGQTQTAGQYLSFYQRGLMYGIPTNPSDQNVYANEIWFKDAIGAQLMTLLLSLSRIPANNQGRAQVLSVIQSVINLALFNGTVSVGKTLTEAQKLYITQVTGNDTAWQQVQTSGYWVDAAVVPYAGQGGNTEYKIIYTLIYSKDDVIRLIEGSNILI